MSKFLKFFFVLITAVSFSFIISCGGDDDDDDDGGTPCTFEADSACFCGENPTNASCDACPTFEGDPECFCAKEGNEEIADCQCLAATFAEDPACFCKWNPDASDCESLNGNGGFEDATLGELGGDGDLGGSWFSQLNAGDEPNVGEIVAAATEGASGEYAVKITVNSLPDNPGTDEANGDNWRIQLVNNGPTFVGGCGGADCDGFQVPANSNFLVMVNVKADQGGRRARIATGRRSACCTDWTGSRNYTLEAGWNEIALFQQATDGDHAADNDEHGAFQINLNWEANLGGTFVIDDVRVITVGEYIDPCADADLFAATYPEEAARTCE